ncbi:hypothetical protein [Streptomyces sp. NPDC001056]
MTVRLPLAAALSALRLPGVAPALATAMAVRCAAVAVRPGRTPRTVAGAPA